MTRTTWTPQQLVTLRKNLDIYFSDEELKQMCLDLRDLHDLADLDYESLPGQGKTAKVIQLVEYMRRHGCIPELVEQCRNLRPSVDWGPADDVSEVLQSGSGQIDRSPQSLSGIAPTSEPSSRRQAKRPPGQSPRVSRTPSRKPTSKKPPQFSWPWKEISAIVVAAIGVVGIYVQYYLPHQASITATQTAEARLTQVALSATPTATSTSTSTPSPTPTFSPTPTPTSTPTPLVTTTIRLDALAVPEDWMSGDQPNPPKYISVTTLFEGCHSGPGCVRWTFKPGGGFASVLWWPLGCNRDTLQTCGINVLERGMFSTVNRLTFWARGDKGGEIIEFKIGGGAALPKSVGLRKVTLESGWRQYEIDVTGLDLTNASALFMWTATDQENPRGAVFYLDSILFEGHRR